MTTTIDDVTGGEKIRAVRVALGITSAERAARLSGLLDRREWEKIESGRLKFSSAKQQRGVAAALGLSVSQVQALYEGVLSVETALQLSTRKAVEVDSPARAQSERAPTPEEQGERMGVAVQLRASEIATYPNLEICLLYHERSGRRWDPAVIAACRAGHFGEHDLPTPEAWTSALDRLQSVLRHATLTGAESRLPKPRTKDH